MTLLNKLITWELEYILYEKQWEFHLKDGCETFKEKISKKVLFTKISLFDYISNTRPTNTAFCGCINNNVLTINFAKDLSPLNHIRPTYFYFSGKIYAKESVIKGSFRMHNIFRLTNLFLVNAFFLQIVIYILCFIFDFIFHCRLNINDSGFFVVAFGTFFLTTLIVIESRILRYFSRSKEEQIYKLLSDLTH